MHFEGCGAEKVLHGWGKMGRMISAGWTVSSSRPQQQNPQFPPSSSPLWRAGVCQGHRWDVGIFPFGSGTCRVSMQVADIWQGGDGSGRLKPFSSSDDPLLAPAWGNSFFLTLFLKKIQVLGFHTKPCEVFPLPRMRWVQLSEVKTVEPQMDAVLGLQNTRPSKIHHFLDDFMVLLEVVT